MLPTAENMAGSQGGCRHRDSLVLAMVPSRAPASTSTTGFLYRGPRLRAAHGDLYWYPYCSFAFVSSSFSSSSFPMNSLSSLIRLSYAAFTIWLSLGTAVPRRTAALPFTRSHHLRTFGNRARSTPAKYATLTQLKFAMSAMLYRPRPPPTR